MTKLPDKRYIAGLMDGEGSFGIYNFSSRGVRWAPVVKIGMTDGFEIIRSLQKEFGGTLFLRKYDNPKYKSNLMWTLRSREKIRRFIKLVQPYLIIKKKQTELILRYYDENQVPWKPYVKLTERELNRRKELYNEMRKLNRKGPAETE